MNQKEEKENTSIRREAHVFTEENINYLIINLKTA